MYGRYRKVDPSKIRTLRRQGLSNTQIAQRLGVSLQVIHYALRKTVPGLLNEPNVTQLARDAQRDGSG